MAARLGLNIEIQYKEIIMNAIKISNIAIRQHNGLYSLNDLHKAAGGADKYSPRYFMRNKQTIELIDELYNCANSHSLAIEKIEGRNGGTYVCQELVISYGMWINANFALKVIRCFLDREKANKKLTPEQKQSIQAAVQQRHHRTGEHWQEIYKKLHAFCKVNSYHEINSKDFQTALNYLGSMKNAPDLFAPQQKEMPDLKALVRHSMYLAQFVFKYHGALSALNRELASGLYSNAEHAYIVACNIARQMQEPLPSPQYWAYYPFDGDCWQKDNYDKLSLDKLGV